MKKILNIEGMNCSHCIQKIEKFVSKVKGVTFIEVNLEAKTLAIDVDSENKIQNVIEVVEDAGFIVAK